MKKTIMKFAAIPMALVMMASTGAFAAPANQPQQPPQQQKQKQVKPHEHKYLRNNKCKICGAEKPAPKPAQQKQQDRRP